MLSLSDDNQSEVIEAFNSTSWYLDDLLNTDNNVFDSMVNHIYPTEHQLNNANVSDTEVSCLIYIYLYRMVLLRLKFLINGINDFDIVNFPFVDGEIPRSTSFSTYSFCSLVHSCLLCIERFGYP